MRGWIAFGGCFFFVIGVARAGVVERAFTSEKKYSDPFNEVDVDVVFTTPSGKETRVPAYWAGGQKWVVRYSSREVGKHAFRSVCTDAANASLNDVKGAVEIEKYEGTNPLWVHGGIRVSSNKRFFEHEDGTPFFWMGDTWWMGLCHRLKWPEEFRTLADDRKKKGFTVVQIVAGLYPDMHQFDPRGANEAGFPWEKEYARIRPEYFDAADERIKWLVEEGMSPCIVGAWGYYMEFMGAEKLKKHWRYLIARYGAMPVTWCAAGEANLPWYLAKGFPYDDRPQVTKWTEVMRYIRATDPFHRPLTIHPTGIGRLSARHATDDSNLLDFDMLQTPHGERGAIEPTVRTVSESYRDQPVMPVINGEAAYEKLMDTIATEWTRRMFWLCMTSGAAGHTYGANGIWQCNRRGAPHGPSPQMGPGNGYGATPWDEAMNFAGSGQMGIGKKLFERFEWWRFEPHPEWAVWAGEESVKWGDWIWGKDVADAKVDAPVGKVTVRKTFAGPLKSSTIWVAADDRFEVMVNGKRVGELATEVASPEGWRRPRKIDLSGAVREGENVIEIVAENVASNVVKNPAGLICGGALLTDGSWEGATVTAKYGEGPWGRVGETSSRMPITAAGIKDEVRVIFVPEASSVELRELGETKWRASQFDPVTGAEREVKLEECGKAPAWGHDWVLVLRQN